MSSQLSQAGLQSPSEGLPPPPPSPDTRIPWYAALFASGLYTGYSPFASGTVGSALAVGLYFIPGFEQPAIMIPATFLTFILGAKAAGLMEKKYGHDPAEVTIDEVLGMWISLLFLPKTLAVAIAAFLVFRILDIVKPWPARRFDSLHGGLGIMLDDIVSAFYTNAMMHLALRFGLLPF